MNRPHFWGCPLTFTAVWKTDGCILNFRGCMSLKGTKQKKLLRFCSFFKYLLAHKILLQLMARAFPFPFLPRFFTLSTDHQLQALTVLLTFSDKQWSSWAKVHNICFVIKASMTFLCLCMDLLHWGSSPVVGHPFVSLGRTEQVLLNKRKSSSSITWLLFWAGLLVFSSFDTRILVVKALTGHTFSSLLKTIKPLRHEVN